MDEKTTEVFYDIFENMARLAPGSDEATRRCLSFFSFPRKNVSMLDIGCGTGAQAVILASELHGTLTAIDTHKPFLERVDELSKHNFMKAKIKTKCMDMKNIPSLDENYDLVWAEGSLYHMGFRQGLNKIKHVLKPNGIVVASDLNWLKPNPPQDVSDFFWKEAPDMVSAEKNMEFIQAEGYKLLGYFTLSFDEHWFTYYAPLAKRVEIYKRHYADDESIMAMLNQLELEIDLFKKHSNYYGYLFYIMQAK